MIESKRTFHGNKKKNSRIFDENSITLRKRSIKHIRSSKNEEDQMKMSVSEELPHDSFLVQYLLHPQSIFVVTWDVFSMIFIIYPSFEVPIHICFNILLVGFWNKLDFIITISFMIEILLNFNTGFYSRGTLIMNRKEISKNYITGWLWIDIISTIPYTWFIDTPLQDEKYTDSNLYRASKVTKLIIICRFLRILKLLRLIRLKRVLIKIEDYISNNFLATAFIFLRLLAGIFFVAHWVACWWFFVGDQDSAIFPTTWITYTGVINKSTSVQYITALYWAFTTMSTVGYGDITPFTIHEKIYTMFTMILGCGIFAYTVGSIGSLVIKQNAVSNAYREQIVGVNRYMKKKDLDYELQFRVRRYLEYVWENKKQNNMDEKHMLSLLSEPLRDEIYTHIYGVVIKYCKVFDRYDHHFISLLTKALDNETFALGDVIFLDGDFSNKIYFIQNGRIDICQKKTNSIYSTLEKSMYFGEIAFFINKPRCATAKCADFVDLLSLSRNSITYLLEKFPEAMQATSIFMLQCAEGDLSDLLVKCYTCNELGHVACNCRKILLNNDLLDTKQRWLRKRQESLAKTIDPYRNEEPNFMRNQKKKKKIRFNIKNIIGKCESVETGFSGDTNLPISIKKFLEKPIIRDSLSANSTVNSSLDHSIPIILPLKQKLGPKYSMIYRDSEPSEQYIDEIDDNDIRTFKSVLMPNRLDNSETENTERALKKTKIEDNRTPLVKNYKPYKNNSMPTPFNTIEEGYEADSGEN